MTVDDTSYFFVFDIQIHCLEQSGYILSLCTNTNLRLWNENASLTRLTEFEDRRNQQINRTFCAIICLIFVKYIYKVDVLNRKSRVVETNLSERRLS